VALDGGEVYQIRTTDVFVSLPSRTDYWNSNGIDRGVSIHHNSSSDPAVNRTMDFVYCGYCVGDAGTLATDVINRVAVSTGLIRGPAASTPDTLCPGRTDWSCGIAGVGQADLHMVREVIAHAATLVEVSFLSNPAEATKLLDDEYERSNGWAIYAGIAEALGSVPLPKDATPSPPTSTPTQTQTTPTNSPVPSSTQTATQVPSCVGDCNGGGDVTVNELITLVNIALGNADASTCPHGISTGLNVDISLIVRAVNNAQNRCSQDLALSGSDRDAIRLTRASLSRW
jgi:hypothetical protein